MLLMSNDDETNAGFVLRRSRRLQGFHVKTKQRCSQFCNCSQSVRKIQRNEKLKLSSDATFNLLISSGFNIWYMYVVCILYNVYPVCLSEILKHPEQYFSKPILILQITIFMIVHEGSHSSGKKSDRLKG